MKKIILAIFGIMILAPAVTKADERYFTYVYEADVLPEGKFEIEQWITNQNGRKEGDYSRWDFRTEFEYGVTQSYQTAFYLNWESTRIGGLEGASDSNDSEFKGVSWENTYQLLNPNLDPLGLATYLEYTTDGVDQELEAKLLLSKPIDRVTLAFNAIYEAEWEKEDGLTEKEATFELTAGASYKLSGNWSTGLEARHKNAFPDGLDLNGKEFTSVSVGPNLHYSNGTVWGTLTVLPQVWGNGDGASGGRNLVHEEEIEVRLIVGYNF